MKKILVVLIVMLTAGCAGMGRMGSGSSGSAGSSGAGTDNTYRPNNFSPMYERMDSSFQPYFGG